jgi:hypothetical protein
LVEEGEGMTTRTTAIALCIADGDLMCICGCPNWHEHSIRDCQGARLIRPGEGYYRVVPPPEQANPGGTPFNACLGCGRAIKAAYPALVMEVPATHVLQAVNP